MANICFTPPPDWHLGPLTANCHSLAFCIGAIVAYLWTFRRIPPEYRDHLDGIACWMTVAGVLGARLLYVVLNPQSLASPIPALYFWEGGLVSYGGFLGAIAAWIIYIRHYGLPMDIMCDALAPAALLGWGIGRMGCFLNWYHEYGIPTDMPWGVVVGNDVPRHPVMLYLSLGHSAMAFVSIWVAKRFQVNTMGPAIIAFGGVRLLFDIWRDYDPAWLWQGSAAISLSFVLFGIWALGHIEPVSSNPATSPEITASTPS